MAATATKRKARKESKSNKAYITVLGCPECERWHVFVGSVAEVVSMNPDNEVVCERFTWRPEHKFKVRDAKIVSESEVDMTPTGKPYES